MYWYSKHERETNNFKILAWPLQSIILTNKQKVFFGVIWILKNPKIIDFLREKYWQHLIQSTTLKAKLIPTGHSIFNRTFSFSHLQISNLRWPAAWWTWFRPFPETSSPSPPSWPSPSCWPPDIGCSSSTVRRRSSKRGSTIRVTGVFPENNLY